MRNPDVISMKTRALHFASSLFFLPFSGVALASTVNCGTFRTSDFYPKIPYLDVTSVYNAKAGQVISNVVNRHNDQAIETDIQSVAGAFKGSARLAQILSDEVENKPYSYVARDR